MLFNSLFSNSFFLGFPKHLQVLTAELRILVRTVSALMTTVADSLIRNALAAATT